MKPPLLRVVHISWHIAWVSVGLLIGLILTPKFGAHFAGLDWLAVAGVLFFTATVKRIKLMLIVSLVAGLLLGLWRASVVTMYISKYKPLYGQTVTLTGKINEDIALGDKSEQKVKLSKIVINERDFYGQIWTSIMADEDLKRGDIITISGTLSPGFGSFQAAMFRAGLTDAYRPVPGDVARVVRDKFADAVRLGVREPQASLGLGYVVGQRSSLPDELDKNLRLLGLTHVVVASGYNLTILVRYTRRKLVKISKYLATSCASVMVIGFAFITGFSPSMTRAALVTGLSLIAWYYGRKIQPIILLMFVAALTALINPSYIWGDIGWYLSFAAFGGVIILAPLIHSYFWGGPASAHPIRQLVVETICAQVTTLPIIGLAFGQFAPLALPANLLILPFIPYAMAFTFIAGVSGLLVPTIAGFAAVPATLILRYMTGVTDVLAATPWASGEASLNGVHIALSYAALIVVAFYMQRVTKHDFASQNLVD